MPIPEAGDTAPDNVEARCVEPRDELYGLEVPMTPMKARNQALLLFSPSEIDNEYASARLEDAVYLA
jgi:hypothetical protein